MAFMLHKGNWTTIGLDLVNCDGGTDTTTPVTVNQSAGNNLLVEPANIPGPGNANRRFYVSVPPAAASSVAGAQVSLSASIPGSGSGQGLPPKAVSTPFYVFDTVVPPDQRRGDPVGPADEQPLPHP